MLSAIGQRTRGLPLFAALLLLLSPLVLDGNTAILAAAPVMSSVEYSTWKRFEFLYFYFSI